MAETASSTMTTVPLHSIVWINESPDNKEIAQDGSSLKVRCLPGSIWGAFGRENPAFNTGWFPSDVFDLRQLLVSHPMVIFELRLNTSLLPSCFGEQAGICLLLGEPSDRTGRWIKLVIEGMKGSVPSAIVLAYQALSDSPVVLHKQPLIDMEIPVSLALRVSSDPSGSKWTFESPLNNNASFQLDDPLPHLSLGLMSHGGPAASPQTAIFKRFEILQL